MIDIPTETLIIKRYTGAWVEGVYVKTESETIEFEASVQPLKGSEVKLLPEHLRQSEHLKIYTEFKLITPDEKNQVPGDTITHEGKTFHIFSVANWSIGTDIPHYKCIAIKQDGQGGGNGQ